MPILYVCQNYNPLSTEFPDNTNVSVIAKHPLLGNILMGEGLQKVDSFSKWMSKEFSGVDDLYLNSSLDYSWQNIETSTSVDDPSIQHENYTVSPSIGYDQLFDIQDFSPSCSSNDTETKVIVVYTVNTCMLSCILKTQMDLIKIDLLAYLRLTFCIFCTKLQVVITGKFLVDPAEVFKYNWSCMFGEVEVPAEVLGNGILCCYAPLHTAGRVPFYVTCSNRFACSQVREFEYLLDSQRAINRSVSGDSIMEQQLWHRLQKLLSLKNPANLDPVTKSFRKNEPIFSKILLLMEDELCLGVEQQLKEKVVSWLFDKVSEDGKGPNVLDELGQGLLHLAAALGLDWIIPPTVATGVSVNFRDVCGWTALHWAAFYGR